MNTNDNDTNADDTCIDMDTGTTEHSKSIKEATIFELLWEIWSRWLSLIRRTWERHLRNCVCEFFNIRSPFESESRLDSESFLDRHQHETEIQKLRTEILNYERRLQELNSEIEQWKLSAAYSEERFTQEKTYLQSEIKNLRFRSEKAVKEMEEMRRSKDDALSRLSEMMGVKLRDNNPAITDLNDPNRPMKLGEQFNELYENDWTEAFVALQNSKAGDEENIIEILLNILKDVNNQCIATSSSQLSGILELLLLKDMAKDDISDFLKSVKDARRLNAEKCVPLLYKQITGENSKCLTASQFNDHCQLYIEKCVRICYLAAVQDPPVFLLFEPGQRGEKYDKQVFKEYTESGIKVRFLVWPAMFLNQGGPLLSKGVVQPLNEKDETD